MKSMRYLLVTSMITGMTLTGYGVQAQDTEPGRRGEPEEQWDVNKEYYEHGNLLYYDSSYTRTWKHFDFPEFGGIYPSDNLDSLFGQFFDFQLGPFEYHPFVFGPYGDFMDSLDLHFYFDSSFFHTPYGFKFFEDLADSSWMDSFFPGLFHDQPFGDPREWSERHREWMDKFREEFAFPHDSLHHFHPDWQHLPRNQKKSAREIEI